MAIGDSIIMKTTNVKRMTIFVATLLVAGLVSGCDAKNTSAETNKEAEVVASGAEMTGETISVSMSETAGGSEKKDIEEIIKDTYAGINDVYVLKESKDVDYLSGILYDNSIVKDIQVDSSTVDFSKEGTYKVTYKVTVDRAALNEYGEVETKTAIGDKTDDTYTVLIEKDVTVVNKDEAQKLADKNVVVNAGNGNKVKKKDGTDVTVEYKAPVSIKVTGGMLVDASTKEEAVQKVVADIEDTTKKQIATSEKDNKTATNSDTDKKDQTASAATSNTGNTNTTKPANTGSANADASKSTTTTTNTNNTGSASTATSKPATNTNTGNTDSSSMSASKHVTNTNTGSSNTTSTAHTHSYSQATCVSPATCSCGQTNGAALGHDFGSNNPTCSRCGAANPNYKAPHTHSWVPVTTYYPAVTHEEDIYETKQVYVGTVPQETGVYQRCTCGFESADPTTMSYHMVEADDGQGHSCSIKSTYEMVPVYETQNVKVGTTTVVDQPAREEITGYKCSTCGATQ